jgi:DNA modification methylase
MTRSIGIERREMSGSVWCAVNNDCVDEVSRMADESIGQIVTSIPFGTQYEYCASYNDFGHNADTAAFFAQMDHLSPGLFRILQPGRVMCVHVKDRILFGNVTGLQFPTVEPFHAMCIEHYRRHGFEYLGLRFIQTDVVRENNQTYRLGYTEMRKDGTKMGAGSPEFVLMFRKPQGDRSRGYADVPVVKDADEYSLARWQVDADAFWRSSGNRLLTAEELARLPHDKLARAFSAQASHTVYDHDAHVALGEALLARGALPRTFTALNPGSWNDDAWNILRMDTLNTVQAAKGREKHVCPLQIDLVDRLIRLYSNKGDVVFDPFGGLMTVPFRAVHLGRHGYGVELNADYFRDGVRYLMEAERDATAPTLFDLMSEEAA